MYIKAIKNDVLICGGTLNELRNKTLITDATKFEKKYTFDEDCIISYHDYQYDYGYWRFIYKHDFLIKNQIFFPDYKRFQDPPFFVKSMAWLFTNPFCCAII